MDAYLSRKLTGISFILMIMVVILHSYNLDIKQGGNILHFCKDANWAIQNFISNGITRVAVPLFFIISGFLLSYGTKLTITTYRLKVSKRIKTLLLPYLIWSIWGILFYYILQSIPASSAFFTKRLIKDYSVIDWLKAIFIDPIPYQLWFLRDLMLLVLLSPVIFHTVRLTRFIVLGVMFFLWVNDYDLSIVSNEALLFFSIGLCQGLRESKMQINPEIGFAAAIIWPVLLIVKLVLAYYNYIIAEMLIHKLAILAGIAGLWFLYDLLSPESIAAKKIMKYSQYSFFIYLSHEPILTIVKKGMFFFLPKTPLGYFLVYITAPILVVITVIILAKSIKKYFRKGYTIIVGGR